MKSNGFRLVQRKFAQGVPIPASSTPVVPPAPERKAEPPHSPRNVYHNNMSARSLLDVVAMQNIHKHKQPMVVLERLREDEIPSPSASPKKTPLRRRRNGPKNNMRLRSDKRKSPDAANGPIRKRKKLSSESTDDIPLVHYLSRPAAKQPTQPNKVNGTDKDRRTGSQLNGNRDDTSSRRSENNQTPRKNSDKDRRTGSQLNGNRDDTSSRGSENNQNPRKNSDRSTDGGFTFKEPAGPVRLRYRLFSKGAAGRPLKKVGRPKLGSRWSSLRSARAPPEPAPRGLAPRGHAPRGIGRRLRNKVVPDKLPAPAAKASGTKRRLSAKRRKSSTTSISSTVVSSKETSEYSSASSREPTPAPPTSHPSLGRDELLELTLPQNLEHYLEGVSFSPSPSNSSKADWCIRAPVKTERLSEQNEPQNVTENVETPTLVATEILETQDDKSVRPKREKKRDSDNQKAGKKRITKLVREKIGTVEKGWQPAKTTRATKKTEPESKSSPDNPPRMLRQSRDSQPPALVDPDVYEFDAEREASRPPSGLRTRRAQASQPQTPAPQPSAPQPSAPQPSASTDDGLADKQAYFDLLPKTAHCVQIKDEPSCPNISLVSKEICSEKKKALIDNLSSSPTLLDKLMSCLTPELHTELDNLIAADLAAGGSKIKQGMAAYLDHKAGTVLEALTFHPTPEEFADPIKYFDKIAPQASKHGLCKIVPPAGFQPPCHMSDTIRFAVIYQYISKMYNRWGSVYRELAAIKAHLRAQSVIFARSPLLDGSEVNLPKFYHAVQRNGGLKKVIERKRWGRVADELKLTKLQHPERKLDPLYMRYLLSYDVLSDQERQNIMAAVERCWTKKYQKMLERARNPFQRQERMLGAECESESSDDESVDGNAAGALQEVEDCIVQGRAMNLATFMKIARSLMDAQFEPSKQPPTAGDVETAYWRAVLLGTEHIVANTASIDTGDEGYGFPKDPEAEYGKHPWNLKVLAQNPNNVLRYLGPVLGVTVPTLHLSMLFSTSCWHRDPHGLPWVEYMHAGAEKIWYGIPKDESANFRRAVEALCPAYCQNKSIWLASEITMVPPNILSEHGVKLSRLLQKPGEYVLVFPEAHTCSITTGYGISESVYFASNAWLTDVYKLFQDLRTSCEPSMFSLEQLLMNGSADPAAPQQVFSVLCTLLSAELDHRGALEARGLKVIERSTSPAAAESSYRRAWNSREQDECEYCRSTLFLSMVTGLTGRKSAMCPEHAIKLLDSKKYKNVDVSDLKFVSSYTTTALEEMFERLDSRIAELPDDIDPIGPEVIDLTDKEATQQV